ncbi:hypothetical protein DE146DRAFT_29805 [Phaeosphaeria sp. MPI-PUGE-AT-0046c]|nr:hypothetical protein DE146DRAFT_29805 [Phaeosphaeria sp. MPI-PUGE-AT-0046c]
MAYQQHPSRTPRYSPGRANEGHNHTSSHSATYSTYEPPSQTHTSANTTNTTRRRESRGTHRSNRRNIYDEDSGSDGDAQNYPPYRHGQHTAHHEHPSRYEVYRSWGSHNSEVDRVIDDPALREAMDRLDGQAGRHNRSTSRQPRPTPTRSYRSPAAQHQPNSRPLGYSNLRDLNESRNPQHPVERRLREDQRSGPYDAIHSVGRPSDYARREQHSSYDCEVGDRRRFEDEEFELYGDRRSHNYH